MHAKNRIDSIAYVVSCVHALRISFFFDCVTSRGTVALRVLRTTTWKPHVGQWKRGCRSVSKLPYAMQRTQHTLVMRRRSKKLKYMQCMHMKNAMDARIELVASCMSCILWFFDCKPCVALRVLRTTWKPYVGLLSSPMWHTANTFLWWISGSAARRNIVIMSNYVMSNYVTLRRQRRVCQFSWCPQRDTSPLWPVIKLQGDSTSDRQFRRRR